MLGQLGLFKPVNSTATRLMREDQSNTIGYQLLGDSANALKMIDECIDVSELSEAVKVSYLLQLIPAKRAFYQLQNQSSMSIGRDIPGVKNAVMALMNWVIEHGDKLTCSHHQGLVSKIVQQKNSMEERAGMFDGYDVERLSNQDRVNVAALSS